MSCSLTLSLSAAQTGPVLWSQNGHYYEIVFTTVSYSDAKVAAAARSHNGWGGHLATVTSDAENAFIIQNLATGASADFAWLGGREPHDDGRWFWDDGPETNIQFSINKTATPPFNFANWGGIEPNDHKANEDYLMINIGSDFAGINLGQWGDADPDPNPSDPVVGYLVEYEPPVISLTIFRAGTNNVILSFGTDTNRTYQLQFTPELPSTNWVNFGAPIPGSGSLETVPASVSEDAATFFRLAVSP